MSGPDPRAAENPTADPTRRARVVTASNRAAGGVYTDRGGPIIVDWLREQGLPG